MRLATKVLGMIFAVVSGTAFSSTTGTNDHKISQSENNILNAKINSIFGSKTPTKILEPIESSAVIKGGVGKTTDGD